MDGKSESPLNYPNFISSPPNQLKALLTNEGFIKLIKSTDDENLVVEALPTVEVAKKAPVNLALILTASSSTKCSEKSQEHTIADLRANILLDEDDDGHKLTPREVFMATICQVSLQSLANQEN